MMEEMTPLLIKSLAILGAITFIGVFVVGLCVVLQKLSD